MTSKTAFTPELVPLVLAIGTATIFCATLQNRKSKKPEQKRSGSTKTHTKTPKNASAKTLEKSSDSSEASKENIRIILQRFRKASLLVDGKVESVGGAEIGDLATTTAPSDTCGLLVYISFAKSATKEKAFQAAKTILNLPLLTQGAWGDGTDTKGFLDITADCKPHLLLVPQANLISKVKSQGKSIQYHGQIEKEKGMELYNHFADCVRALVLEHQYGVQKKSLPEWTKQLLSNKKSNVDTSTPPSKMFQDHSLYSEWDEHGIPIKAANGDDLSKSALKKLKKQYESQKKKYEKHLKSSSNLVTTDKKDWSLLDQSVCTILAGTFGARQALSISSDMGPFCHVVSLWCSTPYGIESRK